MYTVSYTKAEYAAIAALFTSNNFPPIPQNALPDDGIMVYEDTQLIAAGFLYTTNSSLCWLEWVTTNPTASPEARNRALNMLLEKLSQRAKALGFTHIFSSLQDKGLINRYQKAGFNCTDTNMTNVIKELK